MSDVPRDDMVRLVLKNGAIEAKGVVVMDALVSGAFSSSDASEADHGAVILGLRNAGGPTSLVDLCIGQVRSKKMLACARCKLWWMTPEWRESTLQLPPETQFLLTEVSSSSPEPVYALLLPLIDGDFRGTLRSPPATTSR